MQKVQTEHSNSTLVTYFYPCRSELQLAKHVL